MMYIFEMKSNVNSNCIYQPLITVKFPVTLAPISWMNQFLLISLLKISQLCKNLYHSTTMILYILFLHLNIFGYHVNILHIGVYCSRLIYFSYFDPWGYVQYFIRQQSYWNYSILFFGSSTTPEIVSCLLFYPFCIVSKPKRVTICSPI